MRGNPKHTRRVSSVASRVWYEHKGRVVSPFTYTPLTQNAVPFVYLSSSSTTPFLSVVFRCRLRPGADLPGLRGVPYVHSVPLILMKHTGNTERAAFVASKGDPQQYKKNERESRPPPIDDWNQLIFFCFLFLISFRNGPMDVCTGMSISLLTSRARRREDWLYT